MKSSVHKNFFAALMPGPVRRAVPAGELTSSCKSLCLFAVAVLLLAGCNGHTYTPEFLTDSTLRFENGRQSVFTFNPTDCQYTYNLQQRSFRAHTDNMSAFYSVVLASLPVAEGEMIEADLLWSGPRGFEERKAIALEVVKLEGDTAWLWNSSESLKMTVRFE